MLRLQYSSIAAVMLACISFAAQAQDSAEAPSAAAPSASSSGSIAPTSPTQQEPPDKRVFGVLPNYRTANETAVYMPITTKQKFIIASKDSFDYPLVLLAGAIAGLGQWTDQNPSFGQGMAGYARRLGTGYADQAIGNMMTEAIFPTLLHEDPRYFRRGYRIQMVPHLVRGDARLCNSHRFRWNALQLFRGGRQCHGSRDCECLSSPMAEMPPITPRNGSSRSVSIRYHRS